MAYYRWSDSDIYAYESEFGFQVHIAKRHHQIPLPKQEFDFKNKTAEEYVKYYFEYQKLREAAKENNPLVDIGLEYDGESFTFGTEDEMFDFINHLERAGYRI